jgi:type I restriction enzyme M protein
MPPRRRRRQLEPQETIHPLILEAQRRQYLEIQDNRITYHCGRDYTTRWNDAEEQVRARTYAWMILERGYPPERINVEVTVPRRTPSDRADIVLYRDDARQIPFLVVENKGPAVTVPGKRQAIEQGFGNANSLRAAYVLFDCGTDSVLFDLGNFPAGERTRNRLGNRDRLQPNYGIPSQFPLVAGTRADIAAVGSAELETKVRRAHGLIWAGGKRDPLKSFDEWSKLLFAKVYDERMTPNGAPRRFQIGVGESKVQVANRVRGLFSEARQRDPSIFTDPRIDLPDDKIYEVVDTIQNIGLTLIDVDALGHAFEHFFGSIFRGDLGQYFTRRELVRFIVALLRPTDQDFVIDPTCGSGGFLLETLLQVWHYIDTNYAGQPDLERRKFDFAQKNLFGIEIHQILGRVAQTNLLLHKDGHTNIEVDRSALDSLFTNPKIRTDGSIFTLVVGNPPFGDSVERGDTDHLGQNTLDAFNLAAGRSKVDSEFLIIERSLELLKPGGRFGMVVPDGLLNNSGEQSLCPGGRRFLLANARLLAVVSLPDHAFRKSGAQNKTSLLFFRKFASEEQEAFDAALTRVSDAVRHAHPDWPPESVEEAALREIYRERDYHFFLAEADQIGYNPAGGTITQNELYSMAGGRPDPADANTILGQYFVFLSNPEAYPPTRHPQCMTLSVSDLFAAHPSYRLDPKFHLFNHEKLEAAPRGTKEWRIGDLLHRRREEINPAEFPDREFKVLTLTQEGRLEDREAGKGKNPPSWYGQYFTDGSRWFVAHTDDVVFSQIDLWKGCVAVIPREHNGAIFTQEFPIYEVDTARLDPYYAKLLLRSAYFQRAIRAITTGHSNRRRTQQDDFENLRIFLPDRPVQEEIGQAVRTMERRLGEAHTGVRRVMQLFDQTIVGAVTPQEFIRRAVQGAE